jgi:hypothetical protein
MKRASMALASIFAMSSTLALAQTGGANAGAEVREKPGVTAKERSDTRTTGRARDTGDAITTGSDVPQNKPNLSSSPESSDTSRRVK